MELPWNDTGDTKGESTEGPVKELQGYCGEMAESTWGKELGCEKHHGRDEGLGVFCSVSVRSS